MGPVGIFEIKDCQFGSQDSSGQSSWRSIGTLYRLNYHYKQEEKCKILCQVFVQFVFVNEITCNYCFSLQKSICLGNIQKCYACTV